jgi:hypothetical protein
MHRLTQPPDKPTERESLSGNEFGAGGGVRETGEFLALEALFLLPEDFPG